MRVSDVIIKHFKGVKEITTTLNNGVFYVCGINESGKSSFLDGIMFALLGKKAFGKGVWKEITSTGGADTLTTVVLVDDNNNAIARIQRKITKSGDEAAVISMEGSTKFTQDDLNQIIEPIALNPKAFMEMSPQEQAIFLGIDTSDIDKEYKQVYSERTYVGRDVKRLEGAKAESFCEAPEGNVDDLQSLLEQREQMGLKQQRYNSILNRISSYQEEITKREQAIANLRTQIDDLTKEIADYEIDAETIDNINLQIQKAQHSLVAAEQYKSYQRVAKEYNEAKSKYDALSTKLEGIKDEKIKRVQSVNLPFKNLSIDDDGGLVLMHDGKAMPLNSNFFSTGRLWEIAIKILASKQNKLKTIIVKDASLLDDAKLESISNTAQESGLQVLLEMVRDGKDNNSITIIEGNLGDNNDKV